MILFIFDKEVTLLSLLRLMLLSSAIALAGCSTTQEVRLSGRVVDKPILTASQVLDDGNSAAMNDHLEAALAREGVGIKGTLPRGTRKAADVDILVSYVDVWRWDIAMYMKSLTVRLHDASTGELLATGKWSDSPLHGFRDARAVMERLVAEILQKVRGQARQTSDR